MQSQGRPAGAELLEWRSAADARALPPRPEDATAREIEAGSVRLLCLEPAQTRSDRAILYLHGGGFRRGSNNTYAAPLSRIARHCGVAIYAVDYRLAPEHPFPAAIDDALAAYRWVTAQEVSAERLFIAGDSAGGGLAAALLLKIAETRMPRPAGGALFSPWVDLRLNGASFKECADTDQLFSHQAALDAADAYLAGHTADNAYASPVLGDWTDQPPLLIQASEIEVLRDDALDLARAASAAGCTVDAVMFPDTQHIWHLDFPSTAQSTAAIDNLREFVSQPDA